MDASSQFYTNIFANGKDLDVHLHPNTVGILDDQRVCPLVVHVHVPEKGVHEVVGHRTTLTSAQQMTLNSDTRDRRT